MDSLRVSLVSLPVPFVQFRLTAATIRSELAQSNPKPSQEFENIGAGCQGEIRNPTLAAWRRIHNTAVF
jgi:hypothetical protein